MRIWAPILIFFLVQMPAYPVFGSNCIEEQVLQELRSETDASARSKGVSEPLNKVSVRSQKIWQKFDSEASAILAKNFSDKKLYPPENAHVRSLKWIFGDQADGPSHPKTLSEVLRRYNEFMDQQIHDKKLKAKDVLRPVFVFKMPDKRIIWRKFGEEIPKGATFRDQELPDETFQKMILSRVFPIGNTSLTAGGVRRTVFEHDLGHLTSFIDNPQYMGSLIKLYRDMPKHPEFLSKWDQRSFGRSVFQGRIYFYVESMTTVNPATKDSMLNSLVLSNSMRDRMDEISIDEMSRFLKTIPTEELRSRFLKVKDAADSWFTPYGGAARNSGERDMAIHNRFVGLLHIGLHYNKIETLAEFQLAAIRLRNVTAQDWLDQAFIEYVPTNSKLYPYFSAGNSGWASDQFAIQSH